MTEDATHPGLQELQRFANGMLDESASARIEAHLTDCDECIRLIEENPASDPFVNVLRDAEHERTPGTAPNDGKTLRAPGPSHADIDLQAATLVRKPEIATGASPRPSAVVETVIHKGSKPPARPHPTDDAEQFGDYEVLEEIARGGMGVVYKARHTKLNRVVAVKMILAGRLAGEQDVRRFHNEAEAAARLRHPNIVAIHDVGEIDEQHYFSMEFIEGCSLADMTSQTMPPENAAALVKTIANAIDYANSQGVLHRDLKPQNVLIDDHGQPHITDFGLAKQLEVSNDLTSTGVILGTPNYMSPEQATARQDLIGPPTDVYALGAILFELLTQRPPFRGDKTAAVIFDVIESEPPPPRSLAPTVPRDLETICLKCLAKNPADRYPTAGKLAEDLDLYLRGEPISARPLNTIGRVLRWSRHRPFLATLYGAGLTFYSFHLISMAFIRSDVWDLHWMITILMTVWLVCGTAINRLLESPRWRVPAAYAFMAITPILTTAGLANDRGTASAPIAVLIVMIGITPLMLASGRLILFTTAIVIACYLSLVAQARFVPANRVPGEFVVAFITSQLAMGLLVYLWARRVRIVSPELASSSNHTSPSKTTQRG